MDNDIAEPDPSRQRNGVVEGLYGEFTDSLNAKVRYSVSLTESALTIQKISSSPGQDEVVFHLADCLGCLAYKVEDEADVGAFFTAYFYPFKRRWISTGMARQKVEQCFRVAMVQDPLTNLQEAERWARAIREASIRQIPRRHERVCICHCDIALRPNALLAPQCLSVMETRAERCPCYIRGLSPQPGCSPGALVSLSAPSDRPACDRLSEPLALPLWAGCLTPKPNLGLTQACLQICQLCLSHGGSIPPLIYATSNCLKINTFMLF
ncbi:unnamed protein product [Oncorhynchus mykiss]|uniref:Uncharacterized protein n=1 Tax=Oncorhynchus mykiss TaxID=8022 RepID=A0A060WTS3_ONCMY|nr:unnamed protein product [Oncorhynchus mykiss]